MHVPYCKWGKMLTNITMGAQATATVLAKVPDYNVVYSQGLTNDKKVG